MTIDFDVSSGAGACARVTRYQYFGSPINQGPEAYCVQFTQVNNTLTMATLLLGGKQVKSAILNSILKRVTVSIVAVD